MRHATRNRGFTLIEMIVAVGLFAIVMMLATGAYLQLIAINRIAQATATGTDNLAFALESMTRALRTGTAYNCGTPTGGNCLPSGGGSSAIYFTDADQDVAQASYRRSTSNVLCGSGGKGCIVQNYNGVDMRLTDPSVDIQTLRFYVQGAGAYNQGAGNHLQPQVTMSVKGTVSAGPGRPPVPFTIQTGATMRGTDL